MRIPLIRAKQLPAGSALLVVLVLAALGAQGEPGDPLPPPPRAIPVYPVAEPVGPPPSAKEARTPSKTTRSKATKGETKAPVRAVPVESGPGAASQASKRKGQEEAAKKKEVEELKRKVAAVEAEVEKIKREDNSQVPATTPPEEMEKVKVPPPKDLPPRPVTSPTADEPKRSFATENVITGTGGSAPPPPAKGDEKTNAATPAVPSDATEAGVAGGDPVPIGTKTDRPGIVKSPHPPHNEVDVTGLQKGVLAKDPTTMKVFRVP